MELLAVKDIYKFESSFHPQNNRIQPDAKVRSSEYFGFMTSMSKRASSK